jgi:hypothetical protein
MMVIDGAFIGIQCFNSAGAVVQCQNQTTCHSSVLVPMPSHQPGTTTCAVPWQQACNGVPITGCSFVHDHCPIPNAFQNVSGTYTLNK